MKFVRVDGRPATELCPYTCGKCPHLLPSPISPTKTVNLIKSFSKSMHCELRFRQQYKCLRKREEKMFL
jgi:hypothetical protein